MRLAVCMAAWLAAAIAGSAAGEPAPPVDVATGEYGVALALSGQSARAESVFVTMLSRARGDARALNNLGNLRLLRGEPGVALAFYDRALRGDSAAAGIHLNRALALMLMGDDPRAQRAAATGIRLAGGVERAQSLMGLRADKPEPAKAAEAKSWIHRDEVRALLKSAASAVPRDTVRATPPVQTPGSARKKAPTWRSAGARAADQSDAASLVYWMR